MNKIKPFILTVVFLAVAVAVAVGQGTVKGALFDDANGEAVPFANVVLEGTTYGAATDINGFFLINKVPEGNYTLRVRYVGYEEYTEPITIKRGQVITRSIKLKAASQMLEAVVITDNRAEERRIQTQVSVEKISASQIQQMPSIGGQADLAQYLQVLPGISSTGDQGGQLYVRGGSMIQNLTLLDGMIVYNPFHSIGLYSIFETDIILNADIYTGGFGAEYGGRLSSVMDITTRDGNKKRHSGKVGLNTFGASLILEGPLMTEKNKSKTTITYLLSAKNSFLSKSWDLLYAPLYTDLPNGLPFDFTDIYGKLTLNSGYGSKMSLFGFRFDDQVLGYQAIADYHWRNYGAGTNFMLVTGASAILEGSVAYSKYKINLDDASGDNKYSSIGGFNATMAVTNFLGKNRLKVGMSMEGYETDYEFVNQYGQRTTQNEPTNDIAAFATYKLMLGRWIVEPGLRLMYYSTLNDFNFEPRLSAKFNTTDKLRFKFAGGMYSQIFLDARSDNDIVNLFTGFLTSSGSLEHPATFLGQKVTSTIQKAQHLVAGAEYDFTPHLTANAELYFKNFDNLFNSNRNKMYSRMSDAEYGPNGRYPKPEYYMTDFIVERGMAYGLDFSLRYDVERLYLWATYSLGRVQRTEEKEGYPDNTHVYSPHYDRRHTVNLLATYALGNQRQWELSARWTYGSGFPYTQTQGVYQNILFGSLAEDYANANGDFGVHYAELNEGRLPSYHRLDIGAKRKFSFGKRSLLEINLSITNLYSRENIFYFNRITFQRVNQLPILACFGANFSF
ncbi:MAG: TonB-dependent receptor [Bacteroidales bacterium]|nr:TonB-dependent receptor [Bacteroidales bacterium]